MKYLLLIYNNEKLEEQQSPAERGAVMQRYMKFTQDVTAAGVMRAGDPLAPTNTATSVRVRNGKRVLTDGPFAETREQLGGYYLLECATLDEAIKWAAQIPSAETGTIEVRPLVDVASMMQ